MNKKLKEILLVSLIFVVVDQLIKIVLENNMIINQSNVLIKNFLSLTLVRNTGAAFSIFSNSTIFLVIIGILALIGVIYYIIKMDNIDELNVFTYSLLIGGILGNLIDRIVRGYVVDYISINFGNYYFPIFNFADICIVISVILILIFSIKEDLWKSK